MISFFVPGIPATQGSKNQFGVESCKRLPEWRSLVSLMAKQQMDGKTPFDGPVKVLYSFWFPRAKNHFGTGKKSNSMRDDAPLYATAKGDIDKLQRAVNDAMTGIVYHDDKQISQVAAVKMYRETPGVGISVEKL
jgi:crossover junction endodeoxyribonuclease RusA